MTRASGTPESDAPSEPHVDEGEEPGSVDPDHREAPIDQDVVGELNAALPDEPANERDEEARD